MSGARKARMRRFECERGLRHWRAGQHQRGSRSYFIQLKFYIGLVRCISKLTDEKRVEIDGYWLTLGLPS